MKRIYHELSNLIGQIERTMVRKYSHNYTTLMPSPTAPGKHIHSTSRLPSKWTGSA